VTIDRLFKKAQKEKRHITVGPDADGRIRAVYLRDGRNEHSWGFGVSFEEALLSLARQVKTEEREGNAAAY
jgi:hypothetical protein